MKHGIWLQTKGEIFKSFWIWCMYRKMDEGSLIWKPQSAYCWDVERQQKGTGCLIQYEGKYYTVMMFNSMNVKERAKLLQMMIQVTTWYSIFQIAVNLKLLQKVRSQIKEHLNVNLEFQCEKDVHQNWMESHLTEVQKQPISLEEATTCPESSEWTQAMETEMKSLKDNGNTALDSLLKDMGSTSDPCI